MPHGSGGDAPEVSLTHTVALYDPADGRVVHLHQVVVLGGGGRVEEDRAEREAVENARLRGHDVGGLRVQHVTAPLPDRPGVLHVDTATGELVALAPRPSP
ncbi:hypothetical protein [Streptantibioticus cattleyicolor]|uniref:Uncharacterized protein n=1 Tax=Streptantibioticus cattleyicolor (strain ATCC 35852 / DSM 46488 / JCM 4925 / NBRC 14057 / NRRL 8057) TaxID=1003195 RepID=F8JN83_STREN|nr:hypothetical protein [Streptantibioticus cattleyicolor]AEW99159.1 hypothetical protein SCATT_p09660 [Streptantibioticus cattleyicolor NRRL 8057 = DSM 46488]CCB71798.1 protein of unknown function [Streptantibioticus cattleyicolor NRRL 8057 = DSM 46488]